MIINGINKKSYVSEHQIQKANTTQFKPHCHQRSFLPNHLRVGFDLAPGVDTRGLSMTVSNAPTSAPTLLFFFSSSLLLASSSTSLLRATSFFFGCSSCLCSLRCRRRYPLHDRMGSASDDTREHLLDVDGGLAGGPKIRVRGLRRRSEATGQEILRGVGLDVPRGVVMGVIGPSGSGADDAAGQARLLSSPTPKSKVTSHAIADTRQGDHGLV
ncbi:hypothetical protein QYE76_035588 [Lolium multiflorum]|uniref:Uncharacterized protein n=1 Tax=Lolium multiflorum TaxID=4521 RepID=A0AAD8VP51_LOLMU|nr:hypothetical protein QYE76_035586 [Lolium multiflorum]KAK1611914.1 hypothetical protein QYE76_035587 [Lolium multiflorum]KAK1611915.1 hypothetical protein QYE76_035588 [Lolium multiflorum]